MASLRKKERRSGSDRVVERYSGFLVPAKATVFKTKRMLSAIRTPVAAVGQLETSIEHVPVYDDIRFLIFSKQPIVIWNDMMIRRSWTLYWISKYVCFNHIMAIFANTWKVACIKEVEHTTADEHCFPDTALTSGKNLRSHYSSPPHKRPVVRSVHTVAQPESPAESGPGQFHDSTPSHSQLPGSPCFAKESVDGVVRGRVRATFSYSYQGFRADHS